MEQQFPGTQAQHSDFFKKFQLEHLKLERRWEIVVSKISLGNESFCDLSRK